MVVPAQRSADGVEIADTAPLIYYGGDTRYLLTCIARGTDSCLYWVVVENGGWLWRSRLDEDIDVGELRRFPLELSRDVAKLIWGNIGEVAIAEDQTVAVELEDD